VRVLIIDDFKPWSELVTSILEEEGGTEIVGVASNGRDGIRKAVDLAPDVVLLDINLPGMNGFEAAGHIRTLAPNSRVLFVSDHHSHGLAQAAAAAGARGYVSKSNALTELPAAIAAVAAGKVYVSRELSAYRVFDTDVG
jgi:two-component system NarL family response regulator